MPTKMIYRAITAPIPNFDHILNPIRGAMFDVVEPEIERRLRDKWKSDIDFNKIRTDDQKRIATYVQPSGENQQKWIWVTLGTPPHDIPKVPKPPGTSLKFRWAGPGSHNPKTPPFAAPLRLGSGAGSGEYIYPKQVKHPGIQPRYFEKQVKIDYEPIYRKYLQAVFNKSTREEMRRLKSSA